MPFGNPSSKVSVEIQLKYLVPGAISTNIDLMKQDDKCANSQAASGCLTVAPRSSGYDPLIAWMQRNGVPITRQRYLKLAYPKGLPKPAEDEKRLPASLQDWQQFER
jgi:hypothetical protein